MLDFLLAFLAAATVGVLLIPLLRTKVEATGRLDSSLAIYRDQLAEVERERAAGTLSEVDAAAARIEIERRILAAGEQDSLLGTRYSGGAVSSKYLPPALCLLVPALALLVYLQIGTPGLPAAPFAQRGPARAIGRAAPDAERQIAPQIATVRQQLSQTPDDPELLSALGELLTLEADGTVSQPAVEAFTRALRAAPDDPRALYYLGLHELQAGDSRAALRRWLDLEARSPEEAPWLPTLRAEIARVAKTANLDPLQIKPDRKAVQSPTPQATNGTPEPSDEQQRAMADLSPEQRQQAIRGMVDGLAARLTDTPGDRGGWLRLANARRVLGDLPAAAEAYAKADALSPLDTSMLKDWAEAEVRQIPPGALPSREAVAVLHRLEKAEPLNALALFYLGADSLARGDKADAAGRWKRLLDLLPQDAPIREMLEGKIREAEGK